MGSACVLTCRGDRRHRGRATVLVDGRPKSWSLPVYVPAGSLVEVGPAEQGVRSYLAVAGGFEVPPTLGSKATDLLSGLGPPALVSGQRLAVGRAQGPPPAIDFAPYRMPPADLVLPLHPGPRRDWLTARGKQDLFDQTYRVSPNSNRIALRLSGRPSVAVQARSCRARESSGDRWSRVIAERCWCSWPTTRPPGAIPWSPSSTGRRRRTAPRPDQAPLSPSGEPGDPTPPVGDRPARPRPLCARWPSPRAREPVEMANRYFSVDQPGLWPWHDDWR